MYLETRRGDVEMIVWRRLDASLGRLNGQKHLPRRLHNSYASQIRAKIQLSTEAQRITDPVAFQQIIVATFNRVANSS